MRHTFPSGTGALILLLILFLPLALISCDKDADKTKYQMAELPFHDTFRVSLYTPDRAVEEDVLATDSMIASTSVTDSIYMFVDTDDDMGIYMEGLNKMKFSIPFLREDGSVREVFRQGPLARLYGALRDAAALNPGDEDLARKFKAFQKEITVLEDTITLGAIYTSGMTSKWVGASLLTWDYEQNSSFCRFYAYGTEADYQAGLSLEHGLISYRRSSNTFRAILDIEDILVKWASEGIITAKELELVQKMARQTSGMTPAWGWGSVKYANYALDMEMHVEPEYIRTGTFNQDSMLDMLSYSLYGLDSSGNPNKPLWIVIDFSGIIMGNDYEPAS